MFGVDGSGMLDFVQRTRGMKRIGESFQQETQNEVGTQPARQSIRGGRHGWKSVWKLGKKARVGVRGELADKRRTHAPPCMEKRTMDGPS